MSTHREVAAFMLDELEKEEYLYQNYVASEIMDKFGEDFIYYNNNGRIAIDKKVLKEFKILTDGKVVWNRRDRYWRPIEEWDELGKRQSDY